MMKKLYQILTLLPLLMTLATAPSFSQNSFYLKQLDIDQDAPETLEFMLDNNTTFYGFQADITLPDGLIYKVSDLSLNRNRLDSSYGMTTNLSGNVLHIAVYSSPSSQPQPAIQENSGALFTWPVKTNPDFIGGTVYINRIIFVGEKDRDVFLENTKTDIGVLPRSISLSPEKFTLFKGYEGFNADSIQVSYTPDSPYTVRDLEWSSSRESVATINPETKGNNEARAVGEGTAVITAISKNPNKPGLISAQCEVEVKDPDVGLYLTAENLTLEKGSTETVIKALVIYGESPDPGNITWEIEQPEDAEVIRLVETEPVIGEGAKEQICTISAIGNGHAKIIARYKDSANDLAATCDVEVNTYVKEIIVEPVKTLRIGDTHKLEYQIIPEDAINTEVTWTSSDPSKATVDSEGTITAIGLGEVVITGTCSAFSGSTSDSFTLKVLPVLPESITITTDKNDNPIKSLIVFMGRDAQLIATVAPENTTDKTVTWTSSKPEVARIDQTGKLIAEALGKTTITATCGDVSETCEVQITPIQVDEITLNPASVELMVGGSVSISVMLEPENATDKTVTWTSSNEEIATVDDNGTVIALALGDADIIASAGITSAVCKVSVIPTPATSVSLEADKTSFKAGETATITATVLPDDTTDKSLTWTSGDEAVATVDDKGVVTGVSVGEVTITAKTVYGVEGSIKLEVIPTPATSVDLKADKEAFMVGETATITATVLPDDTTDKSLTWTSSDEAIATVDDKGVVTGVSLGEVTITATTIYESEGNKVAGSIKLEVIPTPAESITISGPTELKVGETIELTATVLPEDVTDKAVTWTSENEDVATVDASGVVTAVALGEVVITATCGDKTATCKVYVVPTPVESITLNKSEIELMVGGTFTLVPEILPEDATDKSVTWSAENEDVVTVDASGVVTAVALGETTVTATCGGHTAICKVTVIPTLVESITLNKSEIELMVGGTFTLVPEILPEDATDKNVTWSSVNDAIVTVDASGVVTAVALGETSVTATCGGKTATCKVTVIPTPVESITLKPDAATIIIGETFTLVPEILPEDATDKSVTWSSGNDAVATVDASGVVTAVALGEAVITATCGDKTATCKVTVILPPVGSLTLNESEAELKVGETITLIPEILPENAIINIVTWTSADKAIATVDDSGVVTAAALGEVIITATCGDKTATCKVTVVRTPVTGISLTNTELVMSVGETSELAAIVHPSDATDPSVKWSSDDESIVTVDANGNVTAHASGAAVITVTSVSDPSVKAECKVTVEAEIFAVTEITISDTSLELIEGDTYPLTATVLPANASDRTVTWRSSDLSVATVSADGVVTAVREGTATIYASSSNGLTAECALKVVARVVEVTGISLSNTELLMREGYTSELIAIVHPDNATDKTVTWSSSDESIATVDANGIVTAIKQGNATVTATTVNGKKAECAVTVIPVIVAVSEITINRTELDMTVGDKYVLIATVKPDDATDKTVTWKSSNRAVATVSEDGVVTAVSEGTATIYASSSNGLTVECAVTVHPGEIPVNSISLSNTELLMREGHTAELIAIVRPDNATDKTVIWSSSDESIATVDDKGIVTAIKQGNATITASTTNGKKAECAVTVVPDIVAVASITLNRTELDMTVGDTYTLIATITPDDATDKTVTWKSSNRAVATVSEDGVVTAVSEGTATIYASSSNGLTVECAVTVHPGEIPVMSISLSNTELLMRVGYTSELLAIVRPDNAVDKRVTWSSSDESIATVNEAGIVTAKAVGKVVITATSVYNPSIKADCNVTVQSEAIITAVASITLNRTELELIKDDTFQLIATITPDDATDKTVTWKSSDRSVVTVSDDGLVTGVGVGTATVYASSSNGLTAECIVKVIPGTVEVSGISLTNTELLMREGHTAELIAIVRPDDATDKTVTWSTEDPAVATVDDNGIVTAIKQGVTIITATSSNGMKAICKVTVVPDIVAVASITLNRTELELIKDDTYQLIATITPDDATDKTVTWKSSDRSVVTVSDDGLVTAVGVGTATVYASSSNGLTAECAVTVKPGRVEVSGISLTNTELLMREGYTAELIAIVHPDDATDKTVIWSTSNPEIATVDANGIVTAIKQGNAIITAASANGVKAQCYVTVVPVIIAVTEITISDKELTLIEGDKYTLTATIKPDDATDKTVTWKSSDRAVAIVSEDGTVTAISPGTAAIYASSSNGLTVECALTVIQKEVPVTSISLQPTALNLAEGETATLTATIAPENATDQTVTWTSGNPDIAQVTDGVVTAIKAGTTTITATSHNGKTASCAVTVYERPLTPRQLLRKGDGTTCTFVVMMDIPDSELSELGYRFVVGYTDSEGEYKIIAETPLRYCHTTPEIYNNPSNNFWTFAIVENKEGKILNSNLRHLDGVEEVCFDASVFGYIAKGRGGATIDADDWIKVMPTGVHISTGSSDDMHVAVYTMAGVMVYTNTCRGSISEADMIDLGQFVPGTYVVTVNCGGQMKSKKIVVR